MCENLLDEDANADWTDVTNVEKVWTYSMFLVIRYFPSKASSLAYAILKPYKSKEIIAHLLHTLM